MRIVLILALFFFTALTSAHAESFTGRCVEVNDGDIITVLYNSSKVQVRLKGLDCPEAGQDFGREALEFTRTAVLDRDVWVNVYALDHEKKRIAEVKVDGRDLGMELVKVGLLDEMPEGNSFYGLTYSVDSPKDLTVALTVKLYDRQGAVMAEHFGSRVKNRGAYSISLDFKRACKKSEASYWTVNVKQKS